MKKIKTMVNAAIRKANLDKFSFAQMTSNSDGKTSGSGTMGVFTIGVGLLTFMVGTIDCMVEGKTEIMTQSVIVITIGTGLLGYRKSKDGVVTQDAVTPPTDEEPTATENTDKPLNS